MGLENSPQFGSYIPFLCMDLEVRQNQQGSLYNDRADSLFSKSRSPSNWSAVLLDPCILFKSFRILFNAELCTLLNSSSADLEVQLVQLNHFDRVYSNY